MISNIVTVNARKFDGSLNRTWDCELVSSSAEFIELIGIFKETVVHTDLGTIETGTISREIYWFNKFYSIFIFEYPKGKLRNFYCNINTSPTFENYILEYIDLDIDVLVQPDLSYSILDVVEFEENSVKYGYGQEILAQANAALEEIKSLIKSREFPFDRA